MTEGRRDELERVGELFEGVPEARPEATEAARAALVARFEAAEGPRAQAAVRLRRRVRLVATAGCAAALVAASIFITGRDVAADAYAVQSQPSGLVIVFVNSLDDGEGLQRTLREAGIPAVVEFNDRSDLPPLRGRRGLPPQFRSALPSAGSVGACIARLPGSRMTLELPYPESLAHLADLDPSLQPTLQKSRESLELDTLKRLQRTLSPAGFRRYRRLKTKEEHPIGERKHPHLPVVTTVPPFTFVPTEDLVPPTEEKGVTFIIDPDGLEAGKRLHIATTGSDLKSMAVFNENAVCMASGRARSE